MNPYRGEIDSASALEPSVNAQVCAISLRYQGRGLAKAVEQDAKVQMEAEQRTVALAPDAYRLSSLPEGAITGVYRGGKEAMGSNDLIRYFNETRAMRTKACDFSESPSIYESANPQNADENTSVVAVEKAETSAIKKLTELPRAAIGQLLASAPEWFCSGNAGKREEKKFPLSAFAAILAVAVSLMLIVASSVMLTRAESRVNALTVEADALVGEVSELQSDVNVQNNLLELREIAINEYGMIEERYVEMTYLDTEEEESIEAYEEERDDGIGLSALLSALGIK